MVAGSGRAGLGLPIRAPNTRALPGGVALQLVHQSARRWPRLPREAEARDPKRTTEHSRGPGLSPVGIRTPRGG
ncbi:hypothetical protein NDU88_008525 [Pleurodeles waltl]|uniref:Uncharacterized protein n=1 Tax=Pleurodeles waltl TaxID=8319 RepID=A0AAV7PQM1_PLEWA|nr:hypothetical protein NDU88_008525 [Pleurodeles waltl]